MPPANACPDNIRAYATRVDIPASPYFDDEKSGRASSAKISRTNKCYFYSGTKGNYPYRTRTSDLWIRKDA
jgi:hypothetical protein